MTQLKIIFLHWNGTEDEQPFHLQKIKIKMSKQFISRCLFGTWILNEYPLIWFGSPANIFAFYNIIILIHFYFSITLKIAAHQYKKELIKLVSYVDGITFPSRTDFSQISLAQLTPKNISWYFLFWLYDNAKAVLDTEIIP